MQGYHVQSVCVVCGKAFIGRVDNRPGRGQCCSKACSLELINRPRREAKLAREREKAERTTVCVVCGTEFKDHRKAKYCSDECRKEIARRKAAVHYKTNYVSARETNPIVINKCKWCEREYEINYRAGRSKYCSDTCSKRAEKSTKLIKDRVRRLKTTRKINGAHIDLINRNKIFERDGWKCGLCGKQIDHKLRYPHLMSASIDHIIPLSAGGLHIETNVQAAHFICNSRRREVGPAQLILF